MTSEQIAFIKALETVDQALADHVFEQIVHGVTLAEIKAKIRAAMLSAY